MTRHSNYMKPHCTPSVSRAPWDRKVRRMSVPSNMIDDGLEAFLLLVSQGAGLREQRRMKKEMVENRGWKEGRNLPDDWIYREMKIRSSKKLWSSDICYISKEGHVLYGINNVKHYMEQSPRYNFQDINGFSAFLREDGSNKNDIQIEDHNLVNIAPKGLLKYISNQDVTKDFKIPKVPKTLVSKPKNAISKVNFESSQRISKAIVQTIVKEMLSIVIFKTTPSETGDKKSKYVNIPRMEDCTICKYCQDMKKFGGPGKMKQRCMLKKNMPTLKRKRQSMDKKVGTVDNSLDFENRPSKRRYA